MKITPHDACSECFRPKDRCMCGKVATWTTNTRVCILQHPQEKYKLLNSSRLANLSLENSILKTGLSWPNLKKATGSDLIPSEWGILYFKGQNKSDKAMEITNRKGKQVADIKSIKGIIALDGNWKQAKTLWWRNAWLLKLNRINLNPHHVSLRKQVAPDKLSTIESIALVLNELGENRNILSSLFEQYQKLILKI